MATKTLTITEEAYEALKREKECGESFSDVVMKMSARKPKLSDCAGKWKISDKEWAGISKKLDRSWKTWKNDVLRF